MSPRALATLIRRTSGRDRRGTVPKSVQLKRLSLAGVAFVVAPAILVSTGHTGGSEVPIVSTDVKAVHGGPEAMRKEFAAAVERIDEEFVAAVRARDAGRAASLYAMDARVMPPNALSVEGRDNIRALFETYVQAGLKNMAVKRLASHVLSKRDGYTYGETTFWFAAADPGEPEQILTCKYLLILKKLDGRWLVQLDVYNNDPR